MSVKFKGNEVKLFGTQIKVGDQAPEVFLSAKDLSSVQVGGKKDKIQIINVVPSLDTPVCSIQAKTFNKSASILKNVEVNIVSVDLPFAQDRFCSTNDIKNLNTLSDFKNKEFGKKYGLLIENSALEGLLTRAVIIVDTQGKVIYTEICDEITNEPNYNAALEAVK